MKESNVTINLKIVKDKQIEMTIEELLKEILKEIQGFFKDNYYNIYEGEPCLETYEGDDRVTVEILKEQVMIEDIIHDLMNDVSKKIFKGHLTEENKEDVCED